MNPPPHSTERPGEIPKTAEKEEKAKETVPPAAFTRAEWQEFLKNEDLDKLQKIEAERGQKKSRLEALKKEASSRSEKETWLNNNAEKPTLFGLDISERVKSEISSTVEKEMRENLSIFEKVGLASPGHLATLKSAANEIIYEHFTKTGGSESTTRNYVENELVPKLKGFFQSLTEIYDAHRDENKTPLLFLEIFSTYSGLNVISGGRLDPSGLKTLLLLQKPALNNLAEGFKEYVNLSNDIEKLTGESSNLLGEKVDIGRLFENGQLRLNTKVRIIIPDDPANIDEIVRKQLDPALPENLSGTVKTRAVSWIIEQLKAKNPRVNETRELSAEGKWSDAVDTAAETTGGEESAADQPEETPAGGTGPEKMLSEIKTGNKVLDSIIDFFKNIIPAGFFAKITEWFEKLGIGLSPEFKGLSDPEKKEGVELKKAAKELKLNEETMGILFKNPKQMKQIIQKKSSENLSWADYLGKYLSPEEIEDLKKKPSSNTNSADKIAAILLTPVEEATA